jgi:hypothetical protein
MHSVETRTATDVIVNTTMNAPLTGIVVSNTSMRADQGRRLSLDRSASNLLCIITQTFLQ